MSMHEPLFGDYPIPDETHRVAHRAFPKGTVWMQVRDHFGMLYDNQPFAHLFAHDGRPALAPARLALITIMQFLDNLSDRQAADAVRDRISWKYALGLALDDPGFDYSVLTEFRTRLLTDNPEQLLFDSMLTLLQEAGLLKARGKQRTDSTHVLAAVRLTHRLETVGETMRHALNALAGADPAWLRTHGDPAWVDRYGRRIEQYRLPKGDAERTALALTMGQDGVRLLALLADPVTPPVLPALPAIATLRTIWAQQYEGFSTAIAADLRWRTQETQPPSATIVNSPYDGDARYRTKRETSWLGYKLHITETCDEDLPSVITHVATTPATDADCDQTAAIQAALAKKGVLPAEHYVDMGYTDAALLVSSQHDHGIALVGPVQADSTWQARSGDGFTVAQFALDWEAKQAICPQGKISRWWTPVTDMTNNPGVTIEWDRTECQGCAVRDRCTKAKAGGRAITIREQAAHEALQRARQEQTTRAFKARYARRSGIEGSFTQGNRRADWRHARYRGRTKTWLQHLITAIALNLARVIAWMNETPRAQTRTSAFVAVMGLPA